MPVSVFDVAKYFLWKSIPGTEQAVTHLKLQKLVYYAQAWSLVLLNRPLFEERLEAWVHGPVCPSLYHVYKKYGFNEIILDEPFDPGVFSKEEIEVLDAVWEAYGSYDGRYLEELTHEEEPWLNARGRLGADDYSNNVISEESMRNFYGSFI